MSASRAPRIVRVHSNNDVMQTLQALQRNRAKRNQRHEFLVEGVRALNQAVRFGWRINAFVYAEGRELSDWARNLLVATPAERHIVLSPALMAELSAREETSELLATIEMPADDLQRITSHCSARDDGHAPLIVLFDRPASPGNLGTLIRSCDALGVDGVVVTGHATDVYDPECVRASTGSLFALPAVRVHQQPTLLDWLGSMRTCWPRLQLVGTDESGATTLDHHDFKTPTILLLGNETWGLSAAWREACDALVRIPMRGSASSLNVACAGSIALYEVLRQRAAPSSN